MRLPLGNGFGELSFLPLEVSTPTRRPFSGRGCHALTWRSHGHSLVGCLPV